MGRNDFFWKLPENGSSEKKTQAFLGKEVSLEQNLRVADRANQSEDKCVKNFLAMIWE